MAKRDKFEAWYESEKQFSCYIDKKEYTKKAWYACQDINNRESETLIAENTMMREALEAVSGATQLTHKSWTKKKLLELISSYAQDALSAKPSLVETETFVEDKMFPVVFNESIDTKIKNLELIVEEQKRTIESLNSIIGGEGSLTTDNLIRYSRLNNKNCLFDIISSQI